MNMMMMMMMMMMKITQVVIYDSMGCRSRDATFYLGQWLLRPMKVKVKISQFQPKDRSRLMLYIISDLVFV